MNKNLSAGLAPESFDGYVTQRRRWSKGTMQVMLLRGGLWLPGLTIAQRIHYFATLWYWLYGIPRVIYLVAPLSFLLLGVRPLIVRDVNDLITYYLPHLFVSVAAFQLVNRGMRRIFWSDIYESCIAVQMAVAALAFPFNGRKVHFSVTPKGTDAETRTSRSRLSLWLPQAALVLLIIAGLGSGAVSLATATADRDSTLINMFWAAYNLVILGFGLLLLRQPQQRRKAPRLAKEYPCRIESPAISTDATSVDLSETGLSLRIAIAQPVPPHFNVTINARENRAVTLRCALVRSELRDGQLMVGARFVDRTLEVHRRVIELMFSSPESWDAEWDMVMDAPQHVVRILRSLRDVFARRRALRRLAPRRDCDLTAVLTPRAGPELAARAVDISHTGIGLNLAEPVQHGAELGLTVCWNDYERTTFQVQVVHVKADRGRFHVGLRFVQLNGQQRDDLIRHLYATLHGLEREKKVA